MHKSFTYHLSRTLLTSLLFLALVGVLFSPLATQPVSATNYFVGDTFSLAQYNNQGGSANWSSNWTETNDDAAAGTGNVQITGGELLVSSRFATNDADFEAIQRSVNLSTSVSNTLVLLSYSFRSTNLDGGVGADNLIVEVYNGTAWVTLETISSTNAAAIRNWNITAYKNANFAIRFRISQGFDQANEIVYFDNLAISYVTANTHTSSSVLPYVQTYYIPVPENQALTVMDAINTDAVSPTYVYISITVAANDTVIYYDHWEDGYEAEINNPAQATTEVWGDNHPANGMAPGFATDVFSAGDVIILTNPVDTSNLSLIDFDGGDKLASTEAIAVTRTSWASGSGTLHGGADEVLDTDLWGTRFDFPVHSTTYYDFTYTGITFMASQDNTLIYRNGAYVATLSEGQSYLFNDNVTVGDIFTSSAPVQANLLSGNIGSSYESDWFSLYPYDLLGSEYYAVVGPEGTVPTAIVLQNPNDIAITVNWETTAGAQTAQNIAAHQGVRVTMPTTGSGAHFYTSGSVFQAISVIDSGSFNYDWGYTLIPKNQLTQQAKVGWGVGQDPTLPYTQNGSPVWVVVVGSGTMNVCADYKGDGLGALTDTTSGRHYDRLLSLTNLQRAKVFDTINNDQTGMLLYLCNGSETGNVNKIAVAWGQDPASASTGAPGLDVGTTVPPLPNYTAVKGAELTTDINSDGKFDVGETFEYQIRINNTGALPVAANTITIQDIVPQYTLYVPASTNLYSSYTGLTTAISDNSVPPASTTFPLDEGGVSVNEQLRIAQYFIVSFKVKINSNLPGATRIQNSALVSGLDLHYDPNVEIIVQPPDENSRIGDKIWLDLDGDGIQDPGEPGIPGVTVELRDGSCTPNVTCFTDVTDANGIYGFPNLLTPVTYTVVVKTSTLPPGLALTGDPDTSLDGQHTVALTSLNKPYLGADFGYQGNVSIGDFFWNDLNANGIQDGGETGLSGATVNLTWAGADGNPATTADNLTLSTITSAGGAYNFTHLPAGNYVLEFVTPGGYAHSPQNQGGNDSTDSDASVTSGLTGTYTLTSGQTNTTVDAGFYQPAMIGNLVWNDTNGNGVQDSGENGINNATVTLYASDGTTLVATTTTNASGVYSFSVLSGTYVVGFSNLPAGYVFSSTSQGGDWTKDSDPNPGTGKTASFSVTAGGVNNNIDAGAYNPAIIGNFVWNDANANGIQDGGETGISGAIVNLRDSSGSTILQTTTTNATGVYSFTTVAGSYVLEFLTPSGANRSPANVGSDNTDSDSNATTGLTGAYTLTGGQTNTTVDAGFYFAALSIAKSSSAGGLVSRGDTVTYTINVTNNTTAYHNGIVISDLLPSGTTYLSSPTNTTSVTGYLYGTYRDQFTNQNYSNNQGTLNWTGNWTEVNDDNVAATGNILVINDTGSIPTNAYVVSFIRAGNPPPVRTLTRQANLSTCASATLSFDYRVANTLEAADSFSAEVSSDGTNYTALWTINAAATSTTYTPVTRSLASGFLANPAYIRFTAAYNRAVAGDNDEVRIDNIQVLCASSTQTTKDNITPGGAYPDLVSGIPSSSAPSNLVVAGDLFGLIPGQRMTVTYQVTVNSPISPSGLTSIDNTASVVSAQQPTAQTASTSDLLKARIGDFVWKDLNANGIQDGGETGFSGAIVNLFNPSGVLLQTTTTNSSGAYNFAAAPGSYLLEFVTPGGYAHSPQDQGGDEATDSDASAATGRTAVVAVTAGATNLTVDAGFYQAVTLGDYVWLDRDNDGLQDSNEPGIRGATVKLLDTSNTVLLTTTTGSAGAYSFTVTPGSYVLEFTLPGVFPTKQDQGANDAIDSDANLATGRTGTITMTSGQTNLTVDTGFYTTRLDLGDLPDVYKTLFSPGPAHIVFPDGGDNQPDTMNGRIAVWLGMIIDVWEGDGQPGASASGDDFQTLDDEDGLVLSANGWTKTSAKLPGDPDSTATIEVNSSAATTVFYALWIDWNNDGDFADVDDGFYSGSKATASPATAVISVTVPDSYVPDTNIYMRVRAFDALLTSADFEGTLINGEVEDHWYKFNNSGITTPVTLSYFSAQRSGDLVDFSWSTATETANVGFNLYVEDNGELVCINEQLIPSQVVDSLDRHDYSYSAKVDGDTFYIEDVSVTGEIRQHGPFRTGEEYGDRLEADKIDQAAVQLEYDQKYAEYQNEIKQEMIISDTVLAEAPEPAKIEPLEAELAETNPTETVDEDSLATIRESVDLAKPLLAATLNLSVRITGIYRVTYEMLRDAGLDLAGVSFEKINLTNQGKIVPIYVGGKDKVVPIDDKRTGKTGPIYDDGKNKFGPGAYLEFYGQALDTPYTDTNIYTVQVSRSSIRQISVSDVRLDSGIQPPLSYSETLVVNNQRAYANYAPGNDAWYDTSMLAYNSPQSWSIPFEVSGLADPAASANLELVVWGVTDWPQSPDHHLLVSVNGLQVAGQTFNGLVEQTLEIALPPGALREGANTLELTLPGDTGVDWDLINLDKFSVTYQRSFQAVDGRLTFTAAGQAFKVINLPSENVLVYQLTKKGPVRLGQVQVQADGSTFTATFAGSTQSMTYLVTTTEALYTPLMQATRRPVDLNRPAQYLIISHPNFINGLGALVQARQAQGLTVSVVDVTDLYTKYTYGIFDPQAIQKYIAYAVKNLGTQSVLLVGGDTYDYRNYLGVNSLSFIPSLYATTGPTVKSVPSDPLYADLDHDNVPDLAIGRFPVRTTAELELIVNKTLAYAGSNYGGTAVFASDLNDGVVSFKSISNNLAAGLPGNWSVENIHLDEMSVATARNQLIAAMNRGTALVTFTGHSGPTMWTFSGLFKTTNAAALTNAGRPFVAVQWGCWNTYYVDPVNNSLVQSFLFSGDRGAVAVLGASTLTDSESENLLGALLTPRLVTPGMTVGQALQAAKRELALTHPDLLDVLLGWSLMGDPALVIQP